jgi:hypothetical protein
MSSSMIWTKRILVVAFILAALGAATAFAGSSEVDGAATATLDLYAKEAPTTLGIVRFFGKDSNTSKTLYAAVQAAVLDGQAGAEDGDLIVYAIRNGTLTRLGEFNGQDGKFVVNGDVDVHGGMTLDDMTGFEADDHVHALNNLSNVDTSPTGNLVFLKWNGSAWTAGQPVWGQIGGTIANQSDLQAAIAAATHPRQHSITSSSDHTCPTGTAGALVKSGGTGAAPQVSASVFETNGQLGIGTSSPGQLLHLYRGTGGQDAGVLFRVPGPSPQDSGADGPSNATSFGSVGNGWSDEYYLTNNDGDAANAGLDGGTTSTYLCAYEFDFNSLVPSDAQVTSVVLNCYGKTPSGTNNVKDATIQLTADGGGDEDDLIVGTNKSQGLNWETTTQYTWGAVVNAATVRTGGFGVVFRAFNNDENGQYADLQYVTLTILYNDPDGGSKEVTAGLDATDGGWKVSNGAVLGTNDAIRVNADNVFEIPALTSGRVPYATTNGRLIDSSNLTFDGSALSVGGTAVSLDSHNHTGTYQAADSGLSQLASIATGLVANTSADAFTPRSIAGDASITVTNGNGVSGNPTIGLNLASANTWTGKQTFGELKFNSSIGTEKLTNGEFTSSSGWTPTSPWTISGGVASVNTGSEVSLVCTQFTPVAGKMYFVGYNVVSGSGGLRIRIGNVLGPLHTTGGTHSDFVRAQDTSSLRFLAQQGANLSLDFVSVKEIVGIELGGDLVFMNAACYASSFNDFTPFGSGDGEREIQNVMNLRAKDGQLDHDSLSSSTVAMQGETRFGRNVGASVSELQLAFQALVRRGIALRNRVDALETDRAQLEQALQEERAARRALEARVSALER